METLTHHGVLGMKWGVRKKYDPHPRKGSSKNKETVKRKTAATVKIQEYTKPSEKNVYSSYKVYNQKTTPKQYQKELQKKVEKLIAETGRNYRIKYDPDTNEYLIYIDKQDQR